MKNTKKIKPFLVYLYIILSLFIFNIHVKGQEFENAGEKKNDARSPLYMLSYDHGGVILWGKDHFIKYLHTATDWLDRYPGFKIGLDNEAYFYDYLSLNDTALLKEIQHDLIKYHGRFGIGTCTYGQPLSQFINEESNIRQIGYGLETDQLIFGYTPTVYFMSEHAMHSQIPQILNGFGFKGAIMRTHYMNFGYNPTFDSPVGWWIGMDGSRIATVPTYKGEGSSFGSDTEDNNILCCYPGSCKIPPESFKEKFSGIEPLLASRADDSGLRLEALVREYTGKPGYKWILTDELFPSFPLPVDEYRTMPDDFHVRMPWGYCGNEIWNMSRNAETRVLTAERIAALEYLSGGYNYEDILDRSWKNLLVAQHHDIQICGILKDARKFLPASIGSSDSILNSSMKFFSSRMEGGSFSQITIFNPLSWARREWIEINIILKGNITNVAVVKGKEPVPFEITATEYDSSLKNTRMNLRIYLDIPALSLQSLSVNKSGEIKETVKSIQFDRKNLTIANQFWTIRLDSLGGISEMINNKTGRPVLLKGRNAFFSGTIEGKSHESHGRWDVDDIMLSNNSLTLSESGMIGRIPYRFSMKLSGDSPVISFNAIFTFNGDSIGSVQRNSNEFASDFIHEEKLRFKVFPALGIGTSGIRDLPFTIAETDYKYVEGNYWTCLADGHSGIAFFNRGTMGSVREKDGSFSIPLAYSVFNLMVPVSLHGKFNYEFCLCPFDGKWGQSDLHRMALEYNYPLVISVSAKGSGSLGNQVRLFNIKSDNILLSALFSRRGKVYCRFYESKGSEGELDLFCHNAEKKFTEVDLSGNEQGDLFSPVKFSPWKIRTLRLDNLVLQ